MYLMEYVSCHWGRSGWDSTQVLQIQDLVIKHGNHLDPSEHQAPLHPQESIHYKQL